VRNPRLGKARTLEEFVQVINSIDLHELMNGNCRCPATRAAVVARTTGLQPADKQWLCKMDRQG